MQRQAIDGILKSDWLVRVGPGNRLVSVTVSLTCD